MPRPALTGVTPLIDLIARNFRERQSRLRPALPASAPPGDSLPAPPSPTYSVLVLSAGGQFGAYGAGFLQGWNERPGLLPSRADIDVITGVSTGAMMAAYAYLGSSADALARAKYDALLKDQYTTLHNADVFRPRSKLELLGANSLYNTAPLRERIGRLVSDELVEQVVDEAARSARLLFVGAVDADSGNFEQFDLVAIARDRSHDRRACFAAAILASAAIPVAFEPVFINGRMYVDGGARKHTFLLSAVSDALPAWVEKRLFGILHGDLAVPAQRTKNNLIGVASRTAAIATDQLMLDSAWFVDAEAKRLRFRTGWTAAVDTACDVTANDEQFNPQLGACLWTSGHKRALGDASPWKEIAFWQRP